MRNIGVAFLCLAAVTLCGPAAAQVTAANVYVGATYGQAYAADACASVPGCDTRAAALRAFIGYHFSPHLAVEGGYHNLGNLRGPGGTFVRSNAWDATLVGFWPLLDRFQLYGKLGGFRGAQEGGGALSARKERNYHLMYGLGAQFNATQNLGLRAEWLDYPRMGGGPVLPRGDIKVVTVGAVWRFQ